MTRRLIPSSLALGALAAVAIAGCGSSGDGSTGADAGSGGGGYGSGNPPAVTAQSKSTDAATIATRKTDLGTILVDGQGRTLYLWVADTGKTSTCNDACAQAWPPVLTSGAAKAGTGVEASLLGTTTRRDGQTEVTYAGHPLYTFAGDQAPGQTTGQASDGFGAEWWVVAPDGKAITSG